MKEFVDDVYAVIKKYQDQRGMTFAEAIGLLNLMSDDLSEKCRKGWDKERELNDDNEKWRGG